MATRWVPKIVDKELKDIMREDKLDKKSQAQVMLVKYARVGREVDRMRRLYIPKTKKSKVRFSL